MDRQMSSFELQIRMPKLSQMSQKSNKKYACEIFLRAKHTSTINI